MRYRSLLLAVVFPGLLLITAQSHANESTTHRVASGTFGVAWIASEGLVYIYSPPQKAAPFRVNHLRAHQIVAIDYDGDGRDELAIIDALKKSLFVYDFDESQMVGPFGNNVAEISVGRFHSDEPFESLIAATYSGHVFRWSKEIGNQGWLPIPGDFVKGYRGKVVARTLKDAPAKRTWGDLTLHDTGGDGQDELFAVSAQSPEDLFLYDPDEESFARVPHQLLDVSGKPSTVSLEAPDTTCFNGERENVTLRNGSQTVCDGKFWNTTHKPYIIRMYTPSGRNVLRDSPADHIHHHGLMFAIAANDCDFWAEFPDRPQGKEELAELSAGAVQGDRKSSWVAARLLWKDTNGVEIMQEERTLTAIPYDQATLMTWSSKLSKAKGEKVTLAGRHYFGLGMRFVESMDDGGTFRFSNDQEESTLVRGDERVTKASWAAYTATLDGGEPATAVIFSHPDNFRPMYAFTMGDNSSAFAFLSATLNLYREPYEWKSDEELNLRWGIALLDGNPSNETIEAAYAYWKSTQK